MEMKFETKTKYLKNLLEVEYLSFEEAHDDKGYESKYPYAYTIFEKKDEPDDKYRMRYEIRVFDGSDELEMIWYDSRRTYTRGVYNLNDPEDLRALNNHVKTLKEFYQEISYE